VQVWTRLAPGSAPRVIGALPRECLSDLTFLSLTQPPLHTAPLQYPQNTTADHRYAYLQEGQSMLAPSTPAFTPLTATHRSSVSTRQPTRLAPARPSRRTACPSRPRSPPLLYAFQRRIRGQVTWLTYCSARTAAARSSTPTKCSSRRTPRATTATGPRRGVGPTTSNECRAEDAERAGHDPLCWNDTGGSTMRMAPR
jgi:hypothetical protein